MAGRTSILAAAAAAEPLDHAATFVLVLCTASFAAMLVLASMTWLVRRARRAVPAGLVPAASPARLEARPGGFPVVAPDAVPPPVDGDEPGVFRVVGVERASGADFVAAIPAVSMANARVKAELKGVIVTSIARQAAADPFGNPFAA